jgi:hypothetical protein
MSELIEHTLTPEERAVPADASDHALSPLQVAKREVNALGIHKATFKWACLAQAEPTNKRYGAIVRALTTIAYDTAPRTDARDIYVVSLLDENGQRFYDTVVTDAPNAMIATAGAMMDAIISGLISPEKSHRFAVVRVDHFTNVEVRRRALALLDDDMVARLFKSTKDR